jgi:HlyD family secretion protein
MSNLLKSLLISVSLLAIGAPPSASEEPAALVEIPKPPAVTVLKAEKREIVERRSVTGSVMPREEVSVGTDVSGLLVLELNADIGDVVKQGDILARLDKSALETQLAQIVAQEAQNAASKSQAEAQIVDAEVGVTQAQDDYERARTLAKKGIGAKATSDSAKNGLDSAKAKLNTAKQGIAASDAQAKLIAAQKTEVELRIAKADVKAPADGLILSRNAQLGSVVSGAGGPLFRIAWSAQFEVVADVPEIALAKVVEGQKTEFRITGIDEKLSGSVRKVSPEINAASRLGKVYLTLNANPKIRPGAFAQGEIELSRHNSVAAPESSLVFRDKQAFLQVVKDGTVETRKVELGARAGGFVEITSGLSEGEDLVERAGTFIANGDKVTPVTASDKTGATQ